MASQVVARVNRARRPTKASQAPAPASGRNPTSSATRTTSRHENRLDSVEDTAWPLRTDAGATGMVRKRLMIPFWRSVLRRTAAYAMPLTTVMITTPGVMKST
jgi:hypothetical protein